MSDSYRSARLITNAGLTLTTGTFNGLLSNVSQTVTIAGNKLFNSAGSNSSGLTFTAAAGMVVPIRCQHIKPATGNVVGFLD